jgi:glucose-1-phosphate thymidylyltransferase
MGARREKEGGTMKGIILAGGAGSRLYPLTISVSKQLMPIYDKPMIYYPLSVLMLAGIREILVINTPHEQEGFKRLLGDGSQFGIEISYEVQEKPEGIAHAFILGRRFVENDPVALILGDNIFYGRGLTEAMQRAAAKSCGATIFAYRVSDPERYGVVEFDQEGKAIHLQEKPEDPRSPYAVTGLYFYDNQVVDIAANLKPSHRGELEITDVNMTYLRKGTLMVERLGRGVAWLDTGTHHSLLQAQNFIETIQERQGLRVACLEEIGYNLGYITADDVRKCAETMRGNPYGEYLIRLLKRSS